MEKKITKKDYFAMVAEIVDNSNAENKDELMEFIEKQVQALDKKAAKAKERAAAKKAEGDELTDLVHSVLTDEYQTIADITVVVAETVPDVSASKITARLTKLFNAGVIEKEQISVEDSEGKKRKCMAYRLADVSVPADEE